MGFGKEEWQRWLKIFVPSFVVFNLLAEVVLVFVPKVDHSQAGISWIISGIAMMLWAYLGDWQDL